jgi:hypothetical protein
VTPEETTAAARRIILAGIDEQADDTMGIGEQLEPELGEDPSETDLDAAVTATRAEINDIRAALAARWDRPTDPPSDEREISPEAEAALDLLADLDDVAGALGGAALIVLVADDEPGARALLADLTAEEVDRVAQAAVKLAALAAPVRQPGDEHDVWCTQQPGHDGQCTEVTDAQIAALSLPAEPTDADRDKAHALLADYVQAAKEVDNLYRAPEHRQAAADWMTHAEGVIARGIAAAPGSMLSGAEFSTSPKEPTDG